MSCHFWWALQQRQPQPSILMHVTLCTDHVSTGEEAQAHLREDQAAKNEVGRRPALNVHRNQAVRRAQADPQLALHTLLQHPHLSLRSIALLRKLCWRRTVYILHAAMCACRHCTPAAAD